MGKLLNVIYKVELTIIVKKRETAVSWGISPPAKLVDARHAESLMLCFPPKTDVEKVIAYLKQRYGEKFHSVQSVSIVCRESTKQGVQSGSLVKIAKEWRSDASAKPIKETKGAPLLKYIGKHKDALLSKRFRLISESALLDGEAIWTACNDDGIITQLWIINK
jgi:hypothetical protein